MAETFSFQAEVQQVLNIVINSLYTDKEIFVRELISNASDALEKLRHIRLTEKDILDENLGLEINLSSDDTTGTLTLQDFGIGMTREELIKNLGTIAHSGSKAFLEAIKASGSSNQNLIGQFGVGFYSVFMAARKVTVYSRSWKPDSIGYAWECDGSGTYTLEECEGLRRGTKIVVQLKDDCKDFATNWRLTDIITKYSSYIEFPITLNAEKVKTQQAVWLRSKDQVTETEYKDFYKFLSRKTEDPLDWIHFSSDAPIEINALLYIPETNPELPGMGRIDPSVSLHCRKILISEQPKDFLPEWTRFLKGVVDSADLPLNISRESMQDSALIRKIGQVILKRLMKHLERLETQEPEKFEKFFKTFGFFIKEGVATDFTQRDTLPRLLRYESSTMEPGKLTGLQAYVDRMKPDQKAIYFLSGPSRQAIEAGPYLEAFKSRGLEVLFCVDAVDDFVMSNLGAFAEKDLVAGDSDKVELPNADVQPKGAELEKGELKAFCKWMEETLDKNTVSKVEAGERLVESPVLAVNADKFLTPHMRRMMKAMGKDENLSTLKVNIEINPRHELIHALNGKRKSDPDTAKLIAEQLLDSALISAGLLDDPRAMVSRMNALLTRVSR